MAGLLAWAADVVGGGEESNDEDDSLAIPVVFSPEQQQYAIELDRKAASLTRSIQDLRLRLPPPDISERLPHLHAHSLASNAALALQLNAHSATKEQVQQREIALQDENVAYEKAISSCENKIQERLQEAEFLRTKLEEMSLAEESLKAELERTLAALDAKKYGESGDLLVDSSNMVTTREEAETSMSTLLDKLESKRKELSAKEEMVKDLEIKWAKVQENALKLPTPVQREKVLDKQLHSLIEQLESKQAQAEGLVGEIHLKEMELEKLNGMWRRLETSSAEANATRNRFRRSNSADYIVDPHHRPHQMGGRTENQQRLMLLRSAFVLYILALNIVVFIKISF